VGADLLDGILLHNNINMHNVELNPMVYDFHTEAQNSQRTHGDDFYFSRLCAFVVNVVVSSSLTPFLNPTNLNDQESPTLMPLITALLPAYNERLRGRVCP